MREWMIRYAIVTEEECDEMKQKQKNMRSRTERQHGMISTTHQTPSAELSSLMDDVAASVKMHQPWLR
jgi:hypothetical protein